MSCPSYLCDYDYFDITPVPKPRMTRRDKWSTRECVSRYWEFKDEVRLKKVSIESGGSHIIFMIAMPKSWSEKKRKIHHFAPHQSRPDKDNLEKALLDAIHDEDSHVYDSRVTKLWGLKGGIYVRNGRFSI